jgi:hypothetical protein
VAKLIALDKKDAREYRQGEDGDGKGTYRVGHQTLTCQKVTL